jgi:hypothetical protein
MKDLMIFLLAVFTTVSLHGQDTTNMVKYSPDFDFEDGIYLNFDQVKANNPIPKSRLLTTVNYNDRDFFERLTRNKEISFYDEFGTQTSIPTKSIWGYSNNGVLYINLNNSFNRVTIIGSICHFVANLTTYYRDYYDPYSYGNPYTNRYGGYPYSTRKHSELRQYVLDFDSGEVYDYEISNMEVLLMKDPELHDEYAKLRKRKKKQLKFYYLRKFNERNPLYLPNSNE